MNSLGLNNIIAESHTMSNHWHSLAANQLITHQHVLVACLSTLPTHTDNESQSHTYRTVNTFTHDSRCRWKHTVCQFPFLNNKHTIRHTFLIVKALWQEKNRVWRTLAGHGAKDPLCAYVCYFLMCLQTDSHSCTPGLFADQRSRFLSTHLCMFNFAFVRFCLHRIDCRYVSSSKGASN